MAALPHTANFAATEMVAGNQIRRILGSGTRSFTWAAGIAFLSFIFSEMWRLSQ